MNLTLPDHRIARYESLRRQLVELKSKAEAVADEIAAMARLLPSDYRPPSTEGGTAKVSRPAEAPKQAPKQAPQQAPKQAPQQAPTKALPLPQPPAGRTGWDVSVVRARVIGSRQAENDHATIPMEFI